jgi:cytochrome c553
MIMTAFVCLLVLVLGCARSLDERSDVIGQVHVTHDRSTASARLRSDMRHHFDDLRHIGSLLRAGRLAEAKAIAFWLTRSLREPRVQAQTAESSRLNAAARELVAAPTLASAVRSEARIADACGDCHARTGARAAFERDTIPPRDDLTLASRMRRHRWAADRVWDGIVGASTVQWRAGLEVFTEDIGGHRVHEVATRALTSTSDERAAIYGELLVSCMTCHPSKVETKELHARPYAAQHRREHARVADRR